MEGDTMDPVALKMKEILLEADLSEEDAERAANILWEHIEANAQDWAQMLTMRAVEEL
jgi:hypothetical protein